MTEEKASGFLTPFSALFFLVTMKKSPLSSEQLRVQGKCQFGLASMLIAVVAIAAGCTYIGWKAQIVRQRKAILNEIMARSGGYSWFESLDATRDLLRFVGAQMRPNAFTLIQGRDPSKAPDRFRFWLGDKDLCTLVVPKVFSPEETRVISSAFPEAEVAVDK